MILTRNVSLFSNSSLADEELHCASVTGRSCRQGTGSLRGPQHRKPEAICEETPMKYFLSSTLPTALLSVNCCIGFSCWDPNGQRRIYTDFSHATPSMSAPLLEGSPDGSCHKRKPRSESSSAYIKKATFWLINSLSLSLALIL